MRAAPHHAPGLFSATIHQIRNATPWQFATDQERNRQKTHESATRRLAGDLDGRIIAFLRKNGPSDSRKVAAGIGWKSHSRLGDRLRLLFEDGKLCRSKRVNTFLYAVAYA